MPRVELEDFEAIFRNDPNAKIIPCTSHLLNKTQIIECIDEVFISGSTMSFKARCGCGEINGNFFISENASVVCPKCGKAVTNTTVNELTYDLWIPLPTFAPPILQPIAYLVLKNWLGTLKGNSILSTLLGGEGELPDELLSWYTPGWQEFYDKFDKVVDYYLNEYKPLQRSTTAHRSENIAEFVAKYRDRLFITKIPILNSTLHLMTSNGDLRYQDMSAKQVIEMIKNVSVAEYQYAHSIKPPNFVNATLADIYEIYLEYITTVMRYRLVGKPSKRGFLRQIGAGFRSHWSFRGIITPLSGVHEADNLHVPWKIAMVCLKYEILNLLINRRGMSLAAALRKHGNAELCYDRDIADICEVLIDECPYKGLPVILNRNPSMQLGALQLLFVTKVLNVHTIGISPMIIEAPNADHDGDELNGVFIKEMDAVPAFMAIHPMQTMFDINTPGISSTVSIPAPIQMLYQNWLNADAV
jgi:hypothetical protein